MKINLIRCRALLLGAASGLMLAGCGKASGEKPAAKVAPAEVRPLPNEASLADVVLTQQAFDRLGITTGQVELKDARRSREFGGEAMIPPGSTAVVVSPLAGTVRVPESGTIPVPGSRLQLGDGVCILEPLLTPERYVPTPAERAQITVAQANLVSMQLTAEGDLQQFREQAALAKVTLDRARQLRQDRVGSEQAVDDAVGRLKIAEAGLAAAEQRRQMLQRLSAGLEDPRPEPLSFTAPMSGVLRALQAVPGQRVAAGATLFEVVRTDQIWIRVPVYVGHLPEIRTDMSAEVRLSTTDRAVQSAAPVAAPPAADPTSLTADLYFELGNAKGELRPGQRVFVRLPLQGEDQRLAVPVNAVLYDIHGGTWVYQRRDSLTLRRTRVSVVGTADGFALLASGPAAGTEVVVDGAAEVFGTEFGTGK